MSRWGRRQVEPEERYPEEHFTLPASNISPRPPSRRLLLIICAVAAFTILCTSVGTLVALSLSASNAHRIDRRSASRDAERVNTENQLQNLQAQLSSQQTQLHDQQVRSQKTICVFIIAVVEQAKRNGQTVTPPTIDFIRNFGCTVPPNLTS